MSFLFDSWIIQVGPIRCVAGASCCGSHLPLQWIKFFEASVAPLGSSGPLFVGQIAAITEGVGKG